MKSLPGARPLLAPALLLFGSGCCALVYQVVWFRLLRLVFGASTPATAAVTAVFMGGLGLGSFLLGDRAEHSRQPLAFYARLELGIALAAAATPWLVDAVRGLYVAAGGTVAMGALPGTLARLVLTALVLGLPTSLMGGTLPAVARAVEVVGDPERRRLGGLYAVNTLGAVAATLATTLWSLEALGIRATLWTATLLNLVVALAAGLLSRRAEQAPALAVTTSEAQVAGAAVAPRSLIFAAAALVGFTFFLLELVWYRMLAPLLGGSSYTFGLILAVALAGIGLGGLLYALRGRGKPPTLQSFAWTAALEALAVAMPFALGDRLALLALALRDLGGAGFDGLVTAWLLVTAVVVLPAALVAGYQFPLLIALLGQGREGVARDVGRAYAWNTLGAIVGSLAGGFGLLPLLGAPGAWRLTAVLLALLALAALVARRPRPFLGGLPACYALAAVALALSPGPSAFWRHTPIGAGRFEWDAATPHRALDQVRTQRRTVLWEADGLESSVSAQAIQEYAFLVNGKADGSARGDASTQVVSGLIGAALHPEPRLALVIGLGTGSTAGWLAEVPSIERVDVVEIEPSILRVAADCAAVNHDVLHHPKARLLLGDAREVLQTTSERYDVIFSEPSNPYRAGISSLFSRDFYQAVTERLAPSGLFIQWLQGYEVDAEVVRTTYATLHSVFPAIESWASSRADLLLIASREPIVHDPERTRRRLELEPWRSAMASVWGVTGLEGFYAAHLGTPEFSRALAKAAAGRINTDDRPILEFGFARNLGRQGLFRLAALGDLTRDREEDLPEPIRMAVDLVRLSDFGAARQVAMHGAPTVAKSAGEPLAARIRARGAFLKDDLGAACRLWRSQPEDPVAPIDLLLLAECSAATGDESALPWIDRLERSRPADAQLVRARWSAQRGDWPAAAHEFEHAIQTLETDPWAFEPTLLRALRLARPIAKRDPEVGRRIFDRLQRPLPAYLLDDLRRRILVDLARELDFAGLCVEAFGASEPSTPWTEAFLRLRLTCYREAGHRRAALAERELERFLSESPPGLAAGLDAPR